MIKVRFNKNVGFSDAILIESSGEHSYFCYEIPLQSESFDLLQAKWELEKALVIINQYCSDNSDNDINVATIAEVHNV